HAAGAWLSNGFLPIHIGAGNGAGPTRVGARPRQGQTRRAKTVLYEHVRRVLESLGLADAHDAGRPDGFAGRSDRPHLRAAWGAALRRPAADAWSFYAMRRHLEPPSRHACIGCRDEQMGAQWHATAAKCHSEAGGRNAGFFRELSESVSRGSWHEVAAGS